MIAIADSTRRTMIAKGGCTGTYTLVYAAGSEATDSTDSTEWQEISPYVIEVTVVSHEESAQEQGEPDTGRRVPVYCERPNRRLATVNRAGRKTEPRKAASTWG